MATKKPVLGAFNQGNVPTIACFNKATVALGVDLDDLIAAMQEFVDKCVAPAWGTPAKLVTTKDFQPGAWAVVFLDDADQPDALAYHDLTPDGLPVAKVFVRTTLANRELVSLSASHELVEMLVDPAINLLTTGPDPTATYAYESADPVEELSFPVNGIPMTDFVFPSYFEGFHKPGSVQFDYMKQVSEPFQILPGGYQLVFKDGNWSKLTGTASKAQRLNAEDRRGHRSEQRKIGALVRSRASSTARAASAAIPRMYTIIHDADYRPGAATMLVIDTNSDPYVLKSRQSFDPDARWNMDTTGVQFVRVWQYALTNEKTGGQEPAGIYQS
jgi:hypothetical protein